SLREPPARRRFVRSSGRTRRESPLNGNSPEASAIVPSRPVFGTRTVGDAGIETDAPRISPARSSRSERERVLRAWGFFDIGSPTRPLRSATLPGGDRAFAQDSKGTGDVRAEGPHPARARRSAAHGGHPA